MHTGIAATTSMTECCLSSIVEAQMRIAAELKKNRQRGARNRSICHEVHQTAADPTTCKDGQTLVLVSN